MPGKEAKATNRRRDQRKGPGDVSPGLRGNANFRCASGKAPITVAAVPPLPAALPRRPAAPTACAGLQRPLEAHRSALAADPMAALADVAVRGQPGPTLAEAPAAREWRRTFAGREAPRPAPGLPRATHRASLPSLPR